jgi:uncharacterized protein (TIGR03437 family)
MELRMLRKSTVVALAVSLWMTGAAAAATLGQVVSIGGAPADVALDEARGKLYVANFTANRIDVLSLATKTIQTSINVSSQPSSLSVSPDGHWLLVAHFGNRAAPASPSNGVTLIDLRNNNSKQPFALPHPPLGVAFGVDNKALIVTTTEFILFDPSLGTTALLGTIEGEVAKELPQPPQTFPGEITQASVGASADGYVIWGVGDQILFRYDVFSRNVTTTTYSFAPPLGPRVVAVSNNGNYAAMGYMVTEVDPYYKNLRILSEWAEPLGDLNRGGHAIDGTRNLIYSEVPKTLNDPPVLLVQDLDNLTVRERLQLPEHIAGRSVLSADGSTMYASSDSGVMILPVGKLNTVKRLEASVEDLVFRGNFCDRESATQSFQLRDPGGANVPFTITSSNSGVRVTPSSGTTPAIIKVTVDPNTFASQKGTVAVTLTINSTQSVTVAPSVRVLVNSREPDQRGTVVNVPGKLVDLVADPGKDQYYVLRQDKNQLLVFDGSNNTLKTTLRTCNVPRGMAITHDRRFMLIACEQSRIMTVVDLEILQLRTPISTPNAKFRSVAASGRQILGVAHDQLTDDYAIFSVDLSGLMTSRLPDLGVWENKVTKNTVVTAAPNGSSLLFASSDGSVLLYDANVDAFTVSRKDFLSLSGAYAASAFGEYVIGNRTFNSSLVPTSLIQPTTGNASGFAFVDQGGFFLSAENQSAPGVIARIANMGSGLAVFPTRVVEAPILSVATEPFTRTVAPLFSRGSIIAMTVSGLTILPSGYDASAAVPNIARVVSAADGVSAPAPGGLFSIYGTNLSPTNIASREIPLPTALADSCMTINGQPVPILYVSPTLVNAQMPYQAIGNVTMIVHTPGGVSDNFNLTVQPTSPTVFFGQMPSGQFFPTIVRATNNLMVTDTNPVHRNDVLVVYLTGLGKVSPLVEDGRPAPFEPLAETLTKPEVTLGGVGLPVLYSGLTPGQVGLYQLNVSVPGNAPKGLSIPFTITHNGATNTVSVRVVE